jgi:hypothetical protein
MKKTAVFLLSFLAVYPIAYRSFSQTVSGRSNSLFLDIKTETVIASASGITISWEYPDYPTVIVNKNSVTIKAGLNSGQELKDVQLYINDMPALADRGFAIVQSDPTQKFAKVISKEIQLKDGKNEIKIFARDANGLEQSFTRYVEVKVEQIAVANRTDRALLIGTDDYDEWGDLTNPVFDTKTITDELKNNYGYQTETLIGPTKTVILNKLREYAKKSYMPEDQLFIFIAGHGQFDEVFQEGYVVTKDSKKDDEAKETYLQHSALRTYVNNIPCNHIFIVMDVCYGGTFDQAIAKAGSRGEDDLYNDIAPADFIKRKLQFKTRRYLTSGGKQYVPDGRPGAHSPFARKFLEALRNYGGRDKILTLGEVITYVEAINPEPKYGEFGDNEPGSDFVFVAR